MLAGSLYGCVSAGRVDPSQVMSRYQQLISRTGPQARMGPLQPVPGSTGAPLTVVKNENTGQMIVELSLNEAIYRALANSLDIKVISYDTAIAREDIERAAAVFDYVLFSDASYRRTNRPLATSITGGNEAKVFPFQVGVRQLNPLGGQLALTYTTTRTETVPAGTFNPDWTQNTAFTLTQPLLRNAGLEFNLAQLRVARVNEQIALSQFHGRVLDVITQTETIYWQLVLARQNLSIAERLLERTIQTRDQVRARGELDANRVQITQTEAAVESRRAILIRARKTIKDVQDQLARLMADSSITLLGDYLIIPTTPPSRTQLNVDRADQIAASLKYAPELEQARLAISVSDINVRVSENQTLPKIDLVAGVGVNGEDNSFGSSFSQMGKFSFVDYNAGLQFEYPFGNRQAEASLRRSKLDRYKSVAILQNTADQVAVNVNSFVREIETTWQEMAAQRAAVIASQANLQAIEDRERFRAALTPEFLQLKLQAQESVATSESAELQATVNFNVAQANLGRSTGTALHTSGVKITDAGEDFIRLLSQHVQTPAVGPSAGTGLPGTLPAPLIPSESAPAVTPPVALPPQWLPDGVSPATQPNP